MNLLDGFSKGQYDLVLFKREKQLPYDGTGVWREVLVWTCAPRLLLQPSAPLPLVLSPAPDVYRKHALESLDASGLSWRIVYTSASLNGLQAAVRAGLGITVLPREMVPAGWKLLGEADGLPPLPHTEIVLYRTPGALPRAVTALADHIATALRQQAGKTGLGAESPA